MTVTHRGSREQSSLTSRLWQTRFSTFAVAMGIAVGIVVCPAIAQEDPGEPRSRYIPKGPPPEEGYDPYHDAVQNRAQVVISGVPAYLWRHGCGPTSAGMIIGYWDGQGFVDLIPGDASTQTAAVNQAITSGDLSGADNCSVAGSGHFEDYSCPKDYDGGPLLEDKSETGGAHISNCLGDFMYTSWSAAGNYYGWSSFGDSDNALLDYVAYVNSINGTTYLASARNEYWGTFTWDDLVEEIDHNRPMVFVVDTDGDGVTDHAVPAIGYRDSSGYNEYACFDTWGTGVRWEQFREMSSSYDWGVRGATFFDLMGLPTDAKWEQLPDLSPTGLDVHASDAWPGPVVLADDFLCTTTGPLTEIHVWGSWYQDLRSTVDFTLSIHEDIPADQNPDGYSIPGEILWSGSPTFSYSLYQDPVEEGWYIPSTGTYYPDGESEECWEYVFYLDACDTFVQQGTVDDPVVYWLDVQAQTANFYRMFAWKTSPYHWNDDAVWGEGADPPPSWGELRYPEGHPLEYDSIDLAFSIYADELQAKWSQLPHGPGEGYDEASDYWWQEVKSSAPGEPPVDCPTTAPAEGIDAPRVPTTPPVQAITGGATDAEVNPDPYTVLAERAEFNKVVADDFQSDGRPIELVHWWGSYLDERYAPENYDPPYVLDGWFVSFHHDEVENPGCPPDLLAGDPHPTVLGVYFCPVDAVEIIPTGYDDCLTHPVYEYKADLSCCCLLCSEEDPRSPGYYPATDDAFLEEADYWYWLDIQAVTGVTWDPPACRYDDRVVTGHIPSDVTPDGHFWGWHTSPNANRFDACTGEIVDLTPYPLDCWDYGSWDVPIWQCDTPDEPVNMAFELLTSEIMECPIAAQPQPEVYSTPCTVDSDCDDAAVCINSVCYAPKNRYVSFEPNNPGLTVAFRVTHLASGLQWWVDTPFEAPADPGVWVARLIATPVYRVWSEAVVHVGDCEIVPDAQYDTQAIEVSCDTGNEAHYSAALTLPTVPQPVPQFWADCVGVFNGIRWTPPNGVVNFIDVNAAVKKFTGDPTAPHITWVDLHPEVPNVILNFSDIQQIVDAFMGATYPFSAPPDCP